METPQTLSLIFEIITQLFMPTLQNKRLRRLSIKSAPQQISISEAFISSQPYDCKSKKWMKLTNSVTYCIAKDMLPMYRVEKPRFRRMLAEFDK